MNVGVKRRAYRDVALRKKVRSIERQMYRQRPEMLTATVSISGTVAANAVTNLKPCQLAEGTGVAERLGDKIRVYRIEVRGQCSTNADVYLIQKKSTSDPTAASFGSTKGGYLLDSLNTNQFTEWRHYRNPNVFSGGGAIKFSKSFRGGHVVKYNGSAGTNVVADELIVSILNRDTTTSAVDLAVRIWYTG